MLSQCRHKSQYLACCPCIMTIIKCFVQTHVKHRTCTSFISTRAIFITRRCNNRAVTAVLGRLPLFLHLGQTFPPLIMSLNEYSSFLIVFSALQDTRTHVVVELYDTERSYVEALQILVNVSIFIDSIDWKKGRFFTKFL